VQAFSIDDSATTEIDDALSVQGLGSGTVVFGVHIAAPGLAIAPDSALDKVARERLSTVYMPGWKLTMLPDEVVQAYTLTEGRDCPAVSAVRHARRGHAGGEVGSETKLERVPIAANLRHDQLDEVVTEASLTGEAAADYAHAPELAFAFRLARHLKARARWCAASPRTSTGPTTTSARRQRGPSRRQRAVRISDAPRGAPLDLIVAEAMILANSTWGGWLAEWACRASTAARPACCRA
jgi:exoribonuclease-2